MPYGILTDAAALLFGGIVGSVIGKKVPDELKHTLNTVSGFCALMIGITLVIKLRNLSAVVLSVIVGTVIGELFRLEQRVQGGVKRIAARAMGVNSDLNGTDIDLLCAVAVIFCCSGTGWYGALNEGLTGDGTILITKAILDFCTAVIFSAALGKMVSFLVLPQLIIFMILYFTAKSVLPLISTSMIADFTAVGGVVELMSGMRIAGIKRDIRVINVVPAMILVFFISAFWTTVIA